MGHCEERLLAAQLDALAVVLTAEREAEGRLRLALAEMARLERALEHGEFVDSREWDAAVQAVAGAQRALVAAASQAKQ